MDDKLFDEITGFNEENNHFCDDSTVGSIEEDDCVISTSDGIEEQLYKSINLPESDLHFKNFVEFMEYINNNIYLKDEYYCFKIKYNSFNIEWVFRKKEMIYHNIMRTFNLEKLFNLFLRFLEN